MNMDKTLYIALNRQQVTNMLNKLTKMLFGVNFIIIY